jgi:hypothetical protein
VWKAEIEGRRLRFHLSGINNQNFLMQDEETGSWWQQVTGEAVHGPLRGKRLELVFHDEIGFDLWRREHPRGRVLRPEEGAPGHAFPLDWEAETAKLPVVTTSRAREPLPAREVVVGVEVGGEASAYPLAELRRQSPLLDRVGGVPVALLVGDDGRSVRAFERRLDGRELELYRRPGAAPLRLVDAQTGSEWSFAGDAIAGPLAGRRLTPVYVLADYWFDWRTYHPRTKVYRLGG